ncbi:TPA: NAD-dependent succinate-semialdehyde dehydrogenase [Stenotrophomonas maltophilia]|uniref:NAD-dependent succinate-semialdehyde dehydrogenase n=1 Tax=unclassified Stenotrophomonas TaxID=196198 RepID=UPI002446E218|nr:MULTISPECIES: NAD-dependent succinate-semialdehyde dehydrogenase [unclassified Stenotrophomonas]HDS1366076.1 NAD-dependent succinate-semialdehyde dehydrogenase [Stenotrophomonas maltophilia]MDH0190167.1 NAD-dependent succinate-semialdehyde dehydrogenase [Stenotrophomonas sp. GD04051]MDH0463927.1 NAD-dependent succinate-semialdehyde dehydrogenase [Stenotrophomonas sp. GD03993]MDH0874549.1 NAD-dependent succinate-semialdehyde dehydrogenase [Stenotrophomonas sp. GD03877]MDH2155166.1 NAD-depend
MAYATTNPFTGQVVKTFPDATDAEVAQTLEKADAAFQGWKNTSISERALVLRKAADLLRSRHAEYAALLTLEMGKVAAEAEAEVELSAQILEYYVENAAKLLAPQKLPSQHPSYTEAWVEHEPQGIILAIEPWNFPYYQIVRIAAPQLAAGNVVILKHASNVPQCAAAFDRLFREAGLPEGGFTNLYVNRAQIKTIIEDPRVQGVALTGSEGAGAVVASQAGNALKKSTMELGGADAFVVLADADLDKAARWAVIGRHWNAGQVCCSSKRIIVVDEVYDAFLDKYKRGVAELKAGDPQDSATTLAPLSSKSAVHDLESQLAQAVGHGATVEVIGAEVPKTGAFFQPVLLTMAESNPAYRWEFFGPVSQVIRARDEDDAVRIANDSPFGLGGSVFTQNIAHGVEVAKQISTGMVYINHPTGVAADLPFGGVRRSGYGRELVGLGIKEFVNHKLIAVTDIDGAF